MKKRCVNPYLPSWEYIPDAEPHVFGDRIYVFGSHDRFNGYSFCLNDYVCYSAPVNDLSDWKYEGVIYHRTDDPVNKDGEMCLYAPDVTKGYDGRFYLYYFFDQLPTVSVAVCDTPCGEYQFYGYVHYEDGTLLGRKEHELGQGDPAVLCDNGNVYLYTGFCMPDNVSSPGAMVTVLADDMLTVKTSPNFIIPSAPYSKGTGFEGHEFFEAASIRKIKDTYYFIYSSIKFHELCYATSSSPVTGFQYGGTIISNNDVGIDSYKDRDLPIAFGGNNHGSIEQINGEWYIFYHRHTNGTSYCRQGCAEKIHIAENGKIQQVEMTSQGLNGAPLPASGYYDAYIACNMFTDHPRLMTGDMGAWIPPEYPRITQEGRDGDEYPGYIDNMQSSATVGFKYFTFENVHTITLRVRGCSTEGYFLVKTEPFGDVLARIPVTGSNEWKDYCASLTVSDGTHALYLQYFGQAPMSLAGFSFQ